MEAQQDDTQLEPKENTKPNIKESSRKTRHDVFAALLIIFLVSLSILSVLAFRFIYIPSIFLVVGFSFSLALAASLVLFHFLSSTATFQKSSWRVGGAAAGFLAVFYLLDVTIREPALLESNFYQLRNDQSIERLKEIAGHLRKIEKIGVVAIDQLAFADLNEVKKKLNNYGDGEYQIPLSDLPIQVIPMIKSVKRSYFAVQYLLPETFWNSPWSDTFFNENVKASQRNGVDLLRIFIVESSWNDRKRNIALEVVKKHVEAGIPVKIITKENYIKANLPLNDLEDFVVFDSKFTGHIEHSQNGGIKQVIFSIEEGLIGEREHRFKRLRLYAQDGKEWIADIANSDLTQPIANAETE